MSKQYVAVTAEKSQEVENKLKTMGLFSDLDQFIMLYNQGIINPSSPEIKELADLINESYLNVLLQRRKFFIQSEDESHLSKTLYVLGALEPVLTLKRIANDLIDDGIEDTSIVFIEDKNGVVFYTELNDDTYETEYKEYENAEKTDINHKVIASNPYLSKFVTDAKDDKVFLDVEQLALFDTSLLDEVFGSVEKHLPSN